MYKALTIINQRGSKNKLVTVTRERNLLSQQVSVSRNSIIFALMALRCTLRLQKNREKCNGFINFPLGFKDCF